MASENVSSIKASGGDYTTIAAWEADTDNDLTTGDGTIEVGELANETFTLSGSVNISGATTNSECYRILRNASGARYNPISGTGAKVTQEGDDNVFEIYEEGVRFSGFALEQGGSAQTAARRGIQVLSDGTNANATPLYFEDLTVLISTTADFEHIALDLRTDSGAAGISCPIYARKCVVIGNGTATANWARGLETQVNATYAATLDNCVAYGCETGFRLPDDSANNIVRNSVGAASVTADFAYPSGTTNVDVQYCASDDATADDAGGTGNVINITPSTAFRDAANNDFRLAHEDTELTGAGTDLSASFTTDIQGRTWKNWSIGAYEPTDVDVKDNGSFDTGSYRIGNVRYHRIRLSGTTDNYSSPITTTGARIVYAYLGNVINGSVTAGDIAPLIDPGSSGITPALGWIPITPAGGGRHLVGEVDSVTTSDNIVCILRDPPSRIRFGFGEAYDPSGEGGSLTGTTPDCYIIVEVHY